MRIQKLLGQVGYGSRRNIESLIKEKRITVDNKTAILGQIVTGHERISIDGEIIKIVAPLSKLIIYYKPAGEICSTKDEQGKGTCFDRLPQLSTGRWQAVGRLDAATSGLILFSTSGEWVEYLSHPKRAIERVYWVKVEGLLNVNHLVSLKKGIELEDGIATIKRYDKLTTDNISTCEITVTSGRNRMVRRMFEHLGLHVKKLKRLRYGPFELPAQLLPGKFIDADEKDLIWLDKCVRNTSKKRHHAKHN